MKVLIDTNVVLDVLLKREPFYKDSFTVFQLADQGSFVGYLSAASITDIFYFVRKHWRGTADVHQILSNLISLFSVAPVSETTITNALALRWKDFEDAVQFNVAKENNFTQIITRNESDYETSDIPCVNPAEFIQAFDN